MLIKCNRHKLKIKAVTWLLFPSRDVRFQSEPTHRYVFTLDSAAAFILHHTHH